MIARDIHNVHVRVHRMFRGDCVSKNVASYDTSACTGKKWKKCLVLFQRKLLEVMNFYVRSTKAAPRVAESPLMREARLETEHQTQHHRQAEEPPSKCNQQYILPATMNCTWINNIVAQSCDWSFHAIAKHTVARHTTTFHKEQPLPMQSLTVGRSLNYAMGYSM